jgi:hypothetical protein
MQRGGGAQADTPDGQPAEPAEPAEPAGPRASHKGGGGSRLRAARAPGGDERTRHASPDGDGPVMLLDDGAHDGKAQPAPARQPPADAELGARGVSSVSIVSAVAEAPDRGFDRSQSSALLRLRGQE